MFIDAEVVFVEEFQYISIIFMAIALNEFPFLQLNSSRGVTTEVVGHFDNGASHAINIVGEFPIDGTRHTTLFVRNYIIILYY